MHPLVVFTDKLCRFLAFVGALAVLAMMLHISLDVILRSLFRISMNTTPEIVARYYMVGIAFLPLGLLHLRREMISVELLSTLFGRGLVSRLLDFVVAALGAGIYGLIANASFEKAMREASVGTFVELVRFQMPVWHSFFIVPVGLGIAALVCALLAVTALLPGAAQERIPE
jgi:TRAP-type C4-dicarboxylate transport system permease small subunit